MGDSATQVSSWSTALGHTQQGPRVVRSSVAASSIVLTDSLHILLQDCPRGSPLCTCCNKICGNQLTTIRWPIFWPPRTPLNALTDTPLNTPLHWQTHPWIHPSIDRHTLEYTPPLTDTPLNTPLHWQTHPWIHPSIDRHCLLPQLDTALYKLLPLN